MKKICLLLMFAALSLTTFGQQAFKNANRFKVERAFDPTAKPQKMVADQEMGAKSLTPPSNSPSIQVVSTTDWADMIGYTNFDLQSYGSNSKLIEYYPTTGDISTIWQFGRGIARGSRSVGYNHYSARLGKWLWNEAITNPGSTDDSCSFGASPRLPSNCTATTWGNSQRAGRLGWPNLIWDGTREAIAAYDATPSDINPRSATGGAFTRIHTFQAPVDSAFAARYGTKKAIFDTVATDYTKEAVFHIAASDGGNSYIVSATDDTVGHRQLLGLGSQNNLVVYHSSNAGTSWTPNFIPFISVSNGIGGVKGTGYAIDAKGDQVAVVVQCMTAQPDNGIVTFMFKSSNKGLPGTWTKRVIAKRSRTDTANTGDNFSIATDGVFSIAFDNNNKVHVTSHAGFATLDSAGGATGTFYMNGAFTSGRSGRLYYWNEDLPDNYGFRTIAAPVDVNRDGTLNIPAYTATNGAGPYPQAGLSMSNLTVDANNNVYVTYSAVVEETQVSSNLNVTRDIYIVASYDGGQNWTNPINVAGRLSINACFTNDDGSSGSGLYEEFYPVTNKRVGADNKIHTLFLSDDLAGLARGGTNSIAAINGWGSWRGNAVNYKAISTNDIEGSYLKATFPEQVCAGTTLQIPVAAPTNKLCIYGPVDASSVFIAQLDTTGTAAFLSPIVLGTFTGSANGGVINATFPTNVTGTFDIRIFINNGNAASQPQLYPSTTGEYTITVTSGVPGIPGPLSNLTSTGGTIAPGGNICGVNSVAFNFNTGADRSNLINWNIIPASAGSIQRNGDPLIGVNTSLVTFNQGYNGPVTISARAVNGCGISDSSVFNFTVGGSSVALNISTQTASTAATTGFWEFSAQITGPFAPLAPSVTQNILSLSNPLITPDGYYRFNSNGCPSNVVFWALGVTGLSNAQLAKNITVYPNPAHDNFFVEGSSIEGKATINLFNSLGQSLNISELEMTGDLAARTSINTQGLNKGIYFVRITVGGASTTKRLVIE
jgi:hypothetical protein